MYAQTGNARVRFARQPLDEAHQSLQVRRGLFTAVAVRVVFQAKLDITTVTAVEN